MFLILALIALAIAAGVFGFSILAGAAALLAKLLFGLFCVLAIIALIRNITSGGRSF